MQGDRSWPTCRILGVVQEVFGLCAVPLGAKLMDRCRQEKMDAKEYGKML